MSWSFLYKFGTTSTFDRYSQEELDMEKAMGTTKRCNGILQSIFILSGNVNYLDYPSVAQAKAPDCRIEVVTANRSVYHV